MPPKTGLHPRNRHTGRYDFAALTALKPELLDFVRATPQGEKSIDFADPEAVRALNSALLQLFHGIENWNIPKGYLCPPIPGRSDYIHHAADLLTSKGGVIPRGESVRVLDVGVGSSCIYPIIGHCEYGWRFLGVDIDPVAIGSATRIVESNAGLGAAIELRLQESPPAILKSLLKPEEKFDLMICNPPFHASQAEAAESSRRKWKNLGLSRTSKRAQRAVPKKNFGGQASELWCDGGEIAFIKRIIEEGAELGPRIRWYTTLVSKDSNLLKIGAALKKVGARETRTIDMAQGQKKSRIVAWSF